MNRQMQKGKNDKNPMGTCRKAGREDKNSPAGSAGQKDHEGLKGR